MPVKAVSKAVRKRMAMVREEKEKQKYEAFLKDTGCRPLKLKRAPCGEEENNFRNVLCPDRDGCLDLAVAFNWQGFSCRRCSKKKSISFVN